MTAAPVITATRGGFGLRQASQRLHIDAVRAGHAHRVELEQYVRDAFATKHGAAVRTFMPTLLSFRDRSAVLRGVAGVRGAHEERLYLEHYLDMPVEQALQAALAAAPMRFVATTHLEHGPAAASIPRCEIVEVGNLAGASCRAAVRMVAQLPAYLTEQRYRWIVFTATSALRGILASLGAPLLELASAERWRVAGASDDWGSYYETDPRVYAGFLRHAEGLAGFVTRGDDH
jgi:hypothetical protein